MGVWNGQQHEAEAETPVHTSEQEDDDVHTVFPPNNLPLTPPTSRMSSLDPTLRQSKRARRAEMAARAKGDMDKENATTMKECVQMMIVAASERQQAQQQAQQTMFLESIRLQRERDATRKNESNRKLRFLKSMM